MKVLFIVALAVRLSSLFVIRTSYVPDETWQCTEVAHKMVFGSGHLTWEWREGLRSYLHPLIFAVPLWVLRVTQLDTPWLVVHLPRLLQCLLTFAGDVLLYRLTVKLYGHSQAHYTTIMGLSSWYLYYVTPRPLVNNLESLLVIATLNLWPTRYTDVVTYPSVVLAAVSVAIRPTMVIFWGVLGLHYLYSAPEQRWPAIRKAIFVGVPTLALTLLLDYAFYGRLVLVFWNFLTWNVAGSAVYGAHPWHWYVTQGIPALAGTHAILVVICFWTRRDYPRQFLLVALVSVGFFSCVAHKEFRFLQHLLPLVMLWAGLGLHWVSRRLDSSTLYLGVILHCITNLLPALYLGMLHQRGTIAVVGDLAGMMKPGDRVSFLTPCHATPFHSHLHPAPETTLRYLDCSPGGEGPHEEARFFSDPLAWWEEDRAGGEGGEGGDWVVVFDEGMEALQGRLKEQGYRLVRRYFHAHLLVDDKLSNHLLLFKR